MSSGTRLLHIVTDEKFIDTAYESFETVFPGCNEYLCVGRKRELKFIKKAPVTFIRAQSIFGLKFKNYTADFDAIIFHSFHSWKSYSIALLAKKKTRLIWIGWGYDYYDLVKKSSLDFLRPLTRSIFRERSSLRSGLKKIFLSKYREQALRKIDIFSPVLEEEYDLVKNKLKNFNAKYLPWNYIRKSGFVALRSKKTKNNLLIGNSASYTNNHLDVFDMLCQLDLSCFNKIVCPLSYGDETYKNLVIKKGFELFGERFMPITEFMSFNNYVDMLDTCSCVIMGHLRQQAMGNIIITLKLGAKVFMDTRNPAFKHLRKRGFIIFPLGLFGGEMASSLSQEEKHRNSNLVENRLNCKGLLDKTINLITG